MALSLFSGTIRTRHLESSLGSENVGVERTALAEVVDNAEPNLRLKVFLSGFLQDLQRHGFPQIATS